MFPNASLNYSSSRVREKKMTTVLDLLKEQGFQKGFQQGFEEGFQQGFEEGRQEGRQEDIEKLLSKGILSPREIVSVLEVDLAWVEEIARKIGKKK